MLIPRSIIKRNNPGGLIKDLRMQEATADYLAYQDSKEQDTIKGDLPEEEQISKYNALFGQHIEATNPLFSPKVCQVVAAGSYLPHQNAQ